MAVTRNASKAGNDTVEKEVKTETKPKTPKSPKAPAKSSLASGLKVGDKFPSGIKLLDQDGDEIDVTAEVQNGITVIFAYPKASTPGCTRQACGFRDLYPKYTGNNVKVFGLSADSVKAQKTFQTKQNLQYQLLSDPDYDLITPLGAKKSASGGVTRSHWIIKDGKFSVVQVGIKPEESFTGALKHIEENE